MTTEFDLLPCPFCGSTDALRLKNTYTASFWVSCSEDDGGCGAKATGQFFPGPHRRTRFVYDPEAPEGSTFEARTLGELPPEYRRAAKSAIAAWNRRANVAHAIAAKDAEIGALRAEVERLRDDLMESDEIREKLGHLLTRTAAALKGEPPAGVWHSWHDLPERAERLAEEVDALRAEVAAWRELSDHVHAGACKAIWPDRYTDERTRDVAAALKRAARLEEALALLPDEIVMVEHNPYEGPLMFCCGQRVTLSWHHGLTPTHGKGCWYARMRAMRDEDQEAAMREEGKQ